MSASDLSPDHPLLPPPPGWCAWASAQSFMTELPGHRERVVAEAWFDRNRQSLILAIHQYDESLSQHAPCWLQIQMQEVGPFFARNEVALLGELFADTVTECWDLPR